MYDIKPKIANRPTAGPVPGAGDVALYNFVYALFCINLGLSEGIICTYNPVSQCCSKMPQTFENSMNEWLSSLNKLEKRELDA